MAEPADFLYRALIGAANIQSDRAQRELAMTAEERQRLLTEAQVATFQQALQEAQRKQALREEVISASQVPERVPYKPRPELMEEASMRAILGGAMTPQEAAIGTGRMSLADLAESMRVEGGLTPSAGQALTYRLGERELGQREKAFSTTATMELLKLYPEGRMSLLRMSPEERDALIDNPLRMFKHAIGPSTSAMAAGADQLRALGYYYQAKQAALASEIASGAKDPEAAKRKATFDLIGKESTALINAVNAASQAEDKGLDDDVKSFLKKDILRRAMVLNSLYESIGISAPIASYPPPELGWYTGLWQRFFGKKEKATAPGGGLTPEMQKQIDDALGLGGPSPSPSPSPVPAPDELDEDIQPETPEDLIPAE